MIAKILSLVTIVFVVYVLGIFFVPVQTDEVGKALGIMNFNTYIRENKAKIDMVSDSVTKIS